MNPLERFVLAKAEERAAELYNPGTYQLLRDTAKVMSSKTKAGPFKWRVDVMMSVKPAAIGKKFSEMQREMYRKGVTGKLQLKTGEVEADPVVTESTLIIFWTTLYVAYDGELWHEGDPNAWESVGRVPAEVRV